MRLTDIFRGNGILGLSHGGDRRKGKKIVAELIRQTEALTQQDLRRWRQAHQLAISVEHPDRRLLYNIYNDVALDLHLSGCIEQLNGYVLCKSFKLVKADGDPDEEALKYFEAAWFKQLLWHVLMQRYWGHQLIELGDVTTREDDTLTYSGVSLIPRSHVIPEYGRVTRNADAGWSTGIPYREEPYADWLIEVGSPDDLGLYLKAAIQTIPKKYALAFWDSFAEMFGLPIRIARTSSRDEKEFGRLGRMMENMGSKAWAVLPDSTDIELKESTRGDAFNVYDKRIDRANSELSKLVLLQTMTIDDGSSLSQSQTHLDVLQNLIWEEADRVRDVVNNQLLPKMAKHGFPVAGLRFDWNEPIDYSPEEQVAYERMVLEHFEVDGSYFADKYNMPVGARRTVSLPAPPSGDDDESSGQQHSRPDFFD